MDWMKIGQAGLLIMFIVVMFPAARHWSKNSPKAEAGDWKAALLPLAGVILFIALLISMVR
jgi:hypothetical protein